MPVEKVSIRSLCEQVGVSHLQVTEVLRRVAREVREDREVITQTVGTFYLKKKRPTVKNAFGTMVEVPRRESVALRGPRFPGRVGPTFSVIFLPTREGTEELQASSTDDDRDPDRVFFVRTVDLGWTEHFATAEETTSIRSSLMTFENGAIRSAFNVQTTVEILSITNISGNDESELFFRELGGIEPIDSPLAVGDIFRLEQDVIDRSGGARTGVNRYIGISREGFQIRRAQILI